MFQGFVLRRDDIGNIWASRLGKNDVIVKGYADPAHNSVSADVIKHMGRLPYEQPIKVSCVLELDRIMVLLLQHSVFKFNVLIDIH